MGLSVEEKILVEQRVANSKKSVAVGYLLLIFLGFFGAHRFYLGSVGPAVVMLVMCVLMFLTIWIGIGLVFFVILGIWWLVDLFLIPGIVSSHENQIRQRIMSEVIADSKG